MRFYQIQIPIPKGYTYMYLNNPQFTLCLKDPIVETNKSKREMEAHLTQHRSTACRLLNS